MSWPSNPDNGQQIAGTQQIRLLNLELSLKAPIDWMPKGKPTLWRFTLNYFEWLGDLQESGNAEVARMLVGDWIFQNINAKAECWHSYPLSLRLFAWLRHAPFLLDGADGDFKNAFLTCLNAHAKLLPRVVEHDVGGNHLIKNLKALIAASVCLPSQATQLDGWLDMLKSQLAEQILPDGFHYERSPSYHLQVLVDLIDISDLLADAPDWLTKTIERMLPALATMRHPDGGLALFNDGDIGDAQLLEALDERFGKIPPLSLLPDAGYARLEAGDMVVIFDAGLCCPDHLTAHAHADTLSFEMSVGKQRVIVNSGTYAYQDPLRNHFRSTAAHSTIMVNNEDCAEVFGTFRLGRRPRKVELFRDGDWIIGRHDGYRHLGVTVERRLKLTERGLEGEDWLKGGSGIFFQSAFHSPHEEEGQSARTGQRAIDNDELRLCAPSQVAFKFYELEPTSRHILKPDLAQDRLNPSHSGDAELNVNPSLKQICRADSRAKPEPLNGSGFFRSALVRGRLSGQLLDRITWVLRKPDFQLEVS